LADKCEIQVAYAIGVAKPVSILVNTFGTNKIPEDKIVELVKENFDFTPKAIIDHLNLRRPIYQKTAAYGHFGRDDPDFTWEKLDKVDVLKQKDSASEEVSGETLSAEKLAQEVGAENLAAASEPATETPAPAEPSEPEPVEQTVESTEPVQPESTPTEESSDVPPSINRSW